jgi:hypothetical protein
MNFYTAGTRSHPENQFITLIKGTVNWTTTGHLDQKAVCFVGVAVDLEGQIWQFDVFHFFRWCCNILRERVKDTYKYLKKLQNFFHLYRKLKRLKNWGSAVWKLRPTNGRERCLKNFCIVQNCCDDDDNNDDDNDNNNIIIIIYAPWIVISE